MIVWVITGISESGDHYGPDVLDHLPTDEEVSVWCHNCDGHFGDPGDYYVPGPGFCGSFVYPTIDERESKESLDDTPDDRRGYTETA